MYFVIGLALEMAQNKWSDAQIFIIFLYNYGLPVASPDLSYGGEGRLGEIKKKLILIYTVKHN